MKLQDFYNQLYQTAVRNIEADEYSLDELIDAPDDDRFGLTLLVRPPVEVKNRIQVFLDELRAVDNSQYYYPSSDIHITVLSLISCYKGFELNSISVADYIGQAKKNLKGSEPFIIKFYGITASDSSIMIAGYPKGSALDDLRDSLRSGFQNSGLQQSIDKRYSLKTAHSTVVRFRRKMENKSGFLKTLEKYRDFRFGEFMVREAELVFNDWYQREKRTERLHVFPLIS